MMNAPSPRRSPGFPEKAVIDPERATAVLEELSELEIVLREATQRRQELVLEAVNLGVTTRKIAAAAGTNHSAIVRWTRLSNDN